MFGHGSHITESAYFKLGWYGLGVCCMLILVLVTGPVSPAKAATVWIVNSAGDVDDGTCDDDHCSLREAIKAANTTSGSQNIITFADSMFYFGPATISVTSQLPALEADNITIRGRGLVTIDGSATGSLANGIVIHSSYNKIQGLTITGFSGYGMYGIWVDPPTTTTVVTGNIIGTDGDGIHDKSEGNIIISNFRGIKIEGNYYEEHNQDNGDNVVAGNYIGVAADGVTAEPNCSGGVDIHYSHYNRIGTNNDGVSDELERNIISSNGAHGLYLYDAHYSTIAGNYIGTDASGTLPRGNDAAGVFLFLLSDNNLVEGNVVSANGGTGVVVRGSSNSIIDNYIGTDSSGSTPLGNSVNGVTVYQAEERETLDNQIGYTLLYPSIPSPAIRVPRPNVIAYNGQHGISIDPHSAKDIVDRNGILYNAIFENEGLGINLLPHDCWADGSCCSDGVAPNDPGDVDEGGNGVLNYPTITLAGANGANTFAHAEITNGLPNQQFLIQFFSSPSCDPSGYGEGQHYLGEEILTTNSLGNAQLASIPLSYAPVGSFVTATATKIETGFGAESWPGSTSEFSACHEITDISTYILASLETLKARLKNLLANRQINPEQADVLIDLIDSALGYYESGDIGEAALYLEEFSQVVESLMDGKELEPDVAEYLTETANLMIDLMTGKGSDSR